MGGECSVHVRDQNADKILVAELDGNRFHGRPTCTVYIRGADKSLARPGRTQATATEDFDVHISYLLS